MQRVGPLVVKADELDARVHIQIDEIAIGRRAGIAGIEFLRTAVRSRGSLSGSARSQLRRLHLFALHLPPAAASIVVVLIWVYYTSQIILMGAEVTHSYAKHNGSLKWRDP